MAAEVVAAPNEQTTIPHFLLVVLAAPAAEGMAATLIPSLVAPELLTQAVVAEVAEQSIWGHRFLTEAVALADRGS